MVGTWLYIAKAEILALTSGLRPRRKLLSIIIPTIGILWALFIAPNLMSLLLFGWLPSEYPILLMVLMPGLMRSLMLFLWMMLLFSPIASALQEVRIGQWEIMLSNNVKTRDILIGSFIARIPVNSLTILFVAPVMISPFMVVFEVSLIGQVLVYLTLFLFVICTIWLSNIIGAAIRSKLGDSSRGNDLAKAFAAVAGFSMMIPIMVVQFFPEQSAAIMSSDIFFMLPFIWCADLIVWVSFLFSDAGLGSSVLVGLETILSFDPFVSLALILVFFTVTIGLGLQAADRLYSIKAGVRSEKVITVRRMGLLSRGIQRVLPGPSGVMLVTVMKEFVRKAQNTSSLVFGIIFAAIIPVMASISIAPDEPVRGFFYFSITSAMLLSMTSSMAFGGLSFLESKNQLWMITSAPQGVIKYVKIRMVQSLLFAIPMALVYSCIVSVLMSYNAIQTLLALLIATLVMVGAVMVSIGITTNNPNYEDSTSEAFKGNTGATMLTMMGATFIPTVVLGVLTRFEFLALLAFAPSAVMFLMGSVMIVIGTRRLSRPE
ncbi:MAG: hypothetical protein ACFE7R_09280 [Candidatus Hodarchaeota archaeon]